MSIVIKAKNKEKAKELMRKILENFEKDIEAAYGPVEYTPPIPLPKKVPINILELPDHLRKTAESVCELGRATAYEVSLETGRERAVESSYLNQLVLMGYLKKERIGRKAYFEINLHNKNSVVS